MAFKKLQGFKKMSSSKNVTVYNKPKRVYIPLISSNDINITTLVKVDDYVYKGTVLGKRKGKIKLPILSSVSGTVKGFEEHTYLNGEKVKCVVIENDFENKIIKKATIHEQINKYTKDEFLDILKDNGIVGLGGAGFPTYVKYSSDKKINTLIVNAVECEPYITADFMLLKERCEEILEAIDAIVEINGMEEAFIVVKKSNTTLINIINDFIGSYLKIKLKTVPNRYPMGYEKAIIKYVKDITYDRLPSEKGIVVNNVSTIYAIYQALKQEKPLIERVVTFTGSALKKPQNILVPIGTLVSDVIESIGGIEGDEIVLIAGGPMMGTAVSDDLIVSPTLNSVIVLPKTENNGLTSCIRCGKCNDVCPVKLCPVLIKDNLKNNDRLRKMDVTKCIECGLCSYICPAKINIREFVKTAKEKILEEDKK